MALLACTAAPPIAAQQPPERFITGVATHFAQGAPDPEGSFLLAAQAGILSIRDDMGWQAIEPKRGQFAMPAGWDHYVDAAAGAGIDPLLIFDYGNNAYDGANKPRSNEAIAAFTRFAEFVVKHFQGKVHRYEVWNEWSNSGGGTTPGSVEDYARLLKSVYPALKSIDPGITVLADSIVLGGGSDSDVHKLDELGLLRFADGVSIHPYAAGPEAVVARLQAAEAALRRANNGAAVPLYATEIGWSSNIGDISLTGVAAYSARLLLLARTMPFVKGMWWYDFRNDGSDPKQYEHNFGLVWPDLTPKPDYYAVADVTAALADATLIERRATTDGDDYLLRFRNAAGEEFWAVWTTKDNTLARFNLATQSLFFNGKPSKPLVMHEVGRPSVNRSWVEGDHGTWRLAVTAGAMPVLLQGDLGDISVAGVEHQEFPTDRH
ncbi:MAG: hypothetical protein ACLQJR_23255 [Stellaceae bacterium]